MKIINFHAENVKRIKAVDITPASNTVIVTGKNGAGKSSVLDSIFWALGGASNIQDKPIREGAESAVVKLDLGELLVERHFTEKNSTLKVTRKTEFGHGKPEPSPQALLDKLMGSITFDPLEFARMGSREQYDSLKRLVKIDVDLDAVERQNKTDYDRRTEVNRQRDACEAQGKALKAKLPEDGVYPEPVDVMELIAKRDQQAQAISARDTGRQIISDADRRLAELEKQILDIKAAKKVAEDNLAQLVIPTDAEVVEIRDKIANAQKDNERAVELKQAKQGYESKVAEWKDLNDKSKALTEGMQKRTQERDAAIAAAKMPIEGLSLEGGKVFYKGIPFDQASSAEQLRVSTSIAMASNPSLKVIRIKDGSLLDDDGMNMLKGMADAQDFQIWIERVSDKDPIAVVIEDGMNK